MLATYRETRWQRHVLQTYNTHGRWQQQLSLSPSVSLYLLSDQIGCTKRLCTVFAESSNRCCGSRDMAASGTHRNQFTKPAVQPIWSFSMSMCLEAPPPVASAPCYPSPSPRVSRGSAPPSFVPLPSFLAQRLFRLLRTPLRSLALLLKVPFPVTRHSIRHIVRLLG